MKKLSSSLGANTRHVGRCGDCGRHKRELPPEVPDFSCLSPLKTTYPCERYGSWSIISVHL